MACRLLAISRRRETQLSGAWAGGKKANAGLRVEFGLPPDKAMK